MHMAYSCFDATDQPHAHNLPETDSYPGKRLNSSAQCEALCTANPACVSYVVADCSAGAPPPPPPSPPSAP